MKLKKFNFKIVNSTNDLAIRIIKNTNHKSGIILAEKQKKAEVSLEKNGLLIKVIYL